MYHTKLGLACVYGTYDMHTYTCVFTSVAATCIPGLTCLLVWVVRIKVEYTPGAYTWIERLINASRLANATSKWCRAVYADTNTRHRDEPHPSPLTTRRQCIYYCCYHPCGEGGGGGSRGPRQRQLHDSARSRGIFNTEKELASITMDARCILLVTWCPTSLFVCRVVDDPLSDTFSRSKARKDTSAQNSQAREKKKSSMVYFHSFCMPYWYRNMKTKCLSSRPTGGLYTHVFSLASPLLELLAGKYLLH